MTTEFTGIAKRVYDDMMALDDVGAAEYARIVVSGALAYDLETHHDLLQKHLDEIVVKRVQAFKEGLKKTYISKALKNESTDHLEQVNTILAKADFDFTINQRREYARLQQRDAQGRFKVTRVKIIDHGSQHPLPTKHAKERNIPDVQGISGQDKARYQSAYIQVAQMLEPFAGIPSGDGVVHLTYKDAAGDLTEKTADLARPGTLRLDSSKFKNGGTLQSAEVAIDPSLSVQGAAFDLVGALGGNDYVASRGAAFYNQDPTSGKNLGVQRMEDFNTKWFNPEEGDINNPSDRIFRRVGASSRLLSDIGGDYIPPKGKLALETARIASEHAPQAQKVIGPHADRAAYRYRGVEKKPDVALQNALTSYARVGAERDKSPAEVRQALIEGEWRSKRPGAKPEHFESPLISFFQRRLASTELAELQRKSGVIPPSEGVIINKKGQVVTQAVGYGDDWYLPFNLKTLSQLKGGEYIRTRTWGGPTTEDIYTGLISGARAVTVISHNGVYTIEFDDAFRGSRRFNDKAGRMVKRYGHLLDAVKSQDVSTEGIPPERMEELVTIARRSGNPRGEDYERKAYKKKFDQLKEDEKKDPMMAEATRKALAQDFLEEMSSRTATAGGYANWDQVSREYIDKEAAKERQAYELQFGNVPGITQFDETVARRSAGGRLTDPESAITAMGWDKEWATHLKAAEGSYRASQSPLKLNGLGYDKAQKALREQFPYYISDARFRENKENRAQVDEGYIKPRFTRPQGALAGYYDASIQGQSAGLGAIKETGKVTADRTRYQNYGVNTAGKPKEKEEEKKKEGGVDATGASTVTNKLEEIDNLMELRDHIVDRASLNVKGRGMVAIEDVDQSAMATAFPLLWGKSRDELKDYLGRSEGDRGKKELRAEARKFQDRGLGDVDPKYLAKVDDPAQAKKGKSWNLISALTDSNQNFDFGDERFDPGHEPSMYNNLADEMLQGLDGGVPEKNLDAYIQDQGIHYRLAGQKGTKMEDKPKEPIENNIKKAVQIKQLRRRAKEEQAIRDRIDERERRSAEADAIRNISEFRRETQVEPPLSISQSSGPVLRHGEDPRYP